MNGELPVFTRCCFCLPLRYGLLAWGYLKLIVSGLLTLVYSLVMLITIAMAQLSKGGRWNIDIIFMVLLVALLMTDFVLSLVFIVGGHKKNVKLLRVYYSYGIVFWVLIIGLTLVVFAETLQGLFLHSRPINSWIMRVTDLAGYFVNIVLQGYILLLLRSEIIKLENNCEFRFVNNAAEAECTFIDEVDVAFEKEATGDVEKSEELCALRETELTVQAEESKRRDNVRV